MTTPGRVPRDDRRPTGSVVRLLGGVLLVLIVVAAAASGDEELWSTPDTTTPDVPEPAPPAEVVVPTPPSTDASGRWLSAAGPVLEVLAALLFVAVVVLAALVVLRGNAGGSWWPVPRRRRRSRASVMTPLPEESSSVEPDEDEVLTALREGPPRNAIVRCWMLLERNAADAGMRRAPAETSSEYVERVIAASSVDPRPIAELGALFRAARFSSRPVDEAQRAQAERALRRTLASLDRRTKVRT